MTIKTRLQRTDKDAPAMEAHSRSSKVRSRRHPDPSAARPPVAPQGHRWYLSGKAVLDVTAAVVLLLLAAPVVVLAALLVKLTSRGPAFYTQTRVGQNGRLFAIYKIRTMVHNCESLTGPRWSIPGDPRVTLVGQFLRRTH